MAVRVFPKTLKARLALIGTLATMYIFISTVYLGHGINPFSTTREGSMINETPVDVEEDTGRLALNGTTTSPQSAPDTTATPPASGNAGGSASESKGSSILLVSAVFPLEKTKYPKSKYDAWLKYYLDSITTDVYMYTTPEMAPQFEALRREGLTISIDTNYTTPFEVPPLKGKEELYLRIQKKDRERGRHSNVTDLYAVRNSKLYFLHHALEVQKAKGAIYDYAFWNDPGSFRKEDHQYRDWPSPSKVAEVWDEGSRLSGTNKDDLIFVPIFDLPHSSLSIWTETMGPIDSKFSEGSFFGGSSNAIDWFARAFYTYHDSYLALELFIGKDISLINALMFLFPERFITVWHNDPDAPTHLALKRTNPEDSFLGQCGSVWHHYQFWLSDPSTKELMRDLWIRKATQWHLWGWWKSVDKTRCQDTGVLDMKNVLERKLGTGWHPPGHGATIPDGVTWT